MGFNRERGLPRVPTVHVTRMRTSQRGRYHFMGCVRVRNCHLLCHSKVLRSAPFLQFSQACCLAQHRRVASERSPCHSDRRVRQCKRENDWESGPVASATCTRLSASWPTSSLLRRVPRKISSLKPRVSFSNSEGRYCTMVWQKIRSVSHFLQPPAIDKASGVKRKNICKSKAWRLARKWKHSLRHDHSAPNTGTSTIFRAPFSTTFRWTIFLKPTGID